MKQTKLNRFKRITIIIFFGVVALVCAGLNNPDNYTYDKAKIDTIILDQEYIKEIQRMDTIFIRDSIEKEIINEINEYFNANSYNTHLEIPYYITINGLNYDIDICFIMAQTELETRFGTQGIGRSSSKRSLFGVVSRSYSSYEKAIGDYCNILKRLYLVNGRTEQDLMKNYVTSKGYRYAEAIDYEINLRNMYNNIKEKTDIYQLQNVWKKYKI